VALRWRLARGFYGGGFPGGYGGTYWRDPPASCSPTAQVATSCGCSGDPVSYGYQLVPAPQYIEVPVGAVSAGDGSCATLLNRASLLRQPPPGALGTSDPMTNAPVTEHHGRPFQITVDCVGGSVTVATGSGSAVRLRLSGPEAGEGVTCSPADVQRILRALITVRRESEAPGPPLAGTDHGVHPRGRRRRQRGGGSTIITPRQVLTRCRR